MRFKRAGMLTKLLILVLLLVSVTTFLNLKSQVTALEEQRSELALQVDRQKQENQSLAAAIADKDDPDRIADVARDRLGMVKPGEIVFYFGGDGH